jgi:D-threo-aldose 1-dehydrogenase
MFEEAHRRGVAVPNAAPYTSGMLAKGSNVTPRIVLQKPGEAQLERVRRIEARALVLATQFPQRFLHRRRLRA